MPILGLVSDLLRQCRHGATDASVLMSDPVDTTSISPTISHTAGLPSAPDSSPYTAAPNSSAQSIIIGDRNGRGHFALLSWASGLMVKSAWKGGVPSADSSWSTATDVDCCDVTSDSSEACPGQAQLITGSDPTGRVGIKDASSNFKLSPIRKSADVSRGLEASSSTTATTIEQALMQSDDSYSSSPVAASRTTNTRPESDADIFDACKVHLEFQEPLTKLANEMLAGVVQELGLHEEKLLCFLRQVESSMQPNKYHNALHVLDVMQLMYLQTLEGGPIADICSDPVVKLSALLAALCHDYSHPGFSASFLISTEHQLVKRYGKDSTLEKMHLHCLRQLCNDPATGFMVDLDAAVQERVLNYAEHMILATDTSHHMDFMSAEAPDNPEELVIFKLRFAMKCADLSHCVRKFSIHYAFVERLKAEFYNQGDREREMQLPISPGMDRKEDYRQVAFAQAYFLSNFILPLYTCWSEHTNGNAVVGKMRAVLERNITSWKLLCSGPDTTGHEVTYARSGSAPVRNKLVKGADT